MLHVLSCKLVSLSIRCDLQELVIQSIFVSNSVILLQTSDKSRIVLQDHILKDASLSIVQDAFFAHF